MTAPMIALLTDEQRAEIRAREAAATKGPWETDLLPGPGGGIGVATEGELDLWIIPVQDLDPADAEFIARSRTDVPALLVHLAAEERESAHQREERRRLRGELDLLRSALAEITRVLDSRGGEGPTDGALLGRIAGIVRRVDAGGPS